MRESVRGGDRMKASLFRGDKIFEFTEVDAVDPGVGEV